METLDSQLANYLASSRLLAEDSFSWGEMPLEMACYLNSEQPPVRYLSSVRAIVFRDDNVHILREKRNHFYLMPRGRREKNESPEETLRRELLEETGWSLKELSVREFMHFRHLGPKPTDYRYPYPGFIWLIYTAHADDYTPETIEFDEYVRRVEFHPTDKLQKLHIDKGELALLNAAIGLRRNSVKGAKLDYKGE
ncbi:MAG: hypothetical protein CL876_03675 [Dehalococcoidales bacterium]|nr:hypothetical protein [Dehalococcoidales bacterium]